MKCLVEIEANINKKNNNGETPSLIASKAGHEDIVKYLLEHGAHLN